MSSKLANKRSPRNVYKTSVADSYISASPVRIVNAILTGHGEDHHTTGLYCREKCLVTRRGSVTILQLTLSAPVTCPYTISLTFLPLYGPKERSSIFRANGNGKGGATIWLSVELPANFPVGYYDTHISISLRGCAEVLTHMIHSAIVVLFNPWLIDDETYMEDVSDLKQYLLNDVGTIWRGTLTNPTPYFWEYGQFEPNCLDTALLLLKDLSSDNRRNAASVVEKILSRIAPIDNTGILQNCYSGHYGGGTHPCKWNGSPYIIQKYFRTRSAVKFGQCWISCGVAITLLRALGIPCRPVTCYEAATHSKKLGQVNRYFTPEGDPIHELEDGHIWCYHVLCECWMTRNDLPFGYDGWQLADPSMGDLGHCLGPVPVKAIKEKLYGKMWDADIQVFLSMIHSEIRYYRVTHSYATMSNRQCTLVQVKSDMTGLLMVTNGNNIENYIDITDEYKEQATPTPTPTSLYPYPPPSKDCSIEMTCSSSEVGKDFQITLNLTNNGPMVRTIDGRIVIMSSQYTGQNPNPFMFMQFAGTITPGQGATAELPVRGKQCVRHITEQNMLKIFIVSKTRETHQLLLITQYHKLHSPPLIIRVPESVKLGEIVRANVMFSNPLLSSLSHMVFTIQALGLCTRKEIPYRRLVLPGRQATVEIPLKTSQRGKYQIICNMYCDQLNDIVGTANVIVV